jgi:anhydro-N-acetylmuramic acid kinase
MNLGGFSNVSFEQNEKRIAFDISPVNTVLNFYSNKLGMDYDNKGQHSRSGKISNDLLQELNALNFYQKTNPK